MASPSSAIRILPETERTLAFGSISGSYATVGSPLVHAAVQVILQNLTAGIVSFSLDGTNSMITLAAGASFIFDIQSNRGVSDVLMLAAGTQFWVAQVTAPTSGAVYISALYAASNLPS